ncbi:MAG TPA: hypothetical protein VK766_11340 [Cytophagaceae bacterium]|jgi:hypothetical protein|nr:hypothetical protein [Cytophagaceae bacterium]
MTPDRIKLFLSCFYEQYILECYQGYTMEVSQVELSEKLEKYDVTGYFLKHLDIYVENCSYLKEYSILYNPSLFDIQREANPEVFNELQIFLIENIQFFLYTILEAAINSHGRNMSAPIGLQIQVKPIDNKHIKLIHLIEKAEQKMNDLNVMPPAMG